MHAALGYETPRLNQPRPTPLFGTRRRLTCCTETLSTSAEHPPELLPTRQTLMHLQSRQFGLLSRNSDIKFSYVRYIYINIYIYICVLTYSFESALTYSMRTCASIEGRTDRDKFLLLALNKPGLHDLVQEENEVYPSSSSSFCSLGYRNLRPRAEDTPLGAPSPRPLPAAHVYVYICMYVNMCICVYDGCLLVLIQ